jgi:transglutaminase-like putative cysteine protease
LSETITKEAKSPYDKVIAIKQYLSQMHYSRQVEAPPQDVDRVDYFLFTQKSGDCVYFASAMTVMLRSVGVPSRLCIGYVPGEWNEATGNSNIRAKHSHAWPEVYFPDYGWIQLEAVPMRISESEVTPAIENIEGGLPFGENWADWTTYEDWYYYDSVSDGTQDTWDENLNSGGTNTSFGRRLALILIFAILGIIVLTMLVLWSIASTDQTMHPKCMVKCVSLLH